MIYTSYVVTINIHYVVIIYLLLYWIGTLLLPLYTLYVGRYIIATFVYVCRYTIATYIHISRCMHFPML